MIETVDIPRRRAARILFRTLKAVGYPDVLARQGVWSALWLEDRGIQGGYLLSGFLDYTRNLSYAERAPAPNARGAVICPFPLLLTSAVLSQSARLATECLFFNAPVVPMLMLPGLTDWFVRDKKLVRIRYKGLPCTGLPSGIAFPTEHKTFEAFCFDENEVMEVDLLPATKILLRGKAKRTGRIRMPAKYLDRSRALNFDR